MVSAVKLTCAGEVVKPAMTHYSVTLVTGHSLTGDVTPVDLVPANCLQRRHRLRVAVTAVAALHGG